MYIVLYGGTDSHKEVVVARKVVVNHKLLHCVTVSIKENILQDMSGEAGQCTYMYVWMLHVHYNALCVGVERQRKLVHSQDECVAGGQR